MGRGYPVSPIAWKNTVIVKVGGHGHAIVALSRKDGSVIWQKHDFANASSTPILINVDGQDQLVTTFTDDVVGLDPNNGDLLWSHPHSTSGGSNISTPVWGPDNLLFVSSAYNGGAMVLRLAQSGGQTKVDELWSATVCAYITRTRSVLAATSTRRAATLDCADDRHRRQHGQRSLA